MLFVVCEKNVYIGSSSKPIVDFLCMTSMKRMATRFF